jgi:ElaB/YqjD/DUF883 family membrane-anchored ribosome-binding protein
MTDLTRGKSGEDRRLDEVLNFLKQWRPEVTLYVKCEGTGGETLGQLFELLHALGAKVDHVVDEAARLKTEVQEIRAAISEAVLRFQTIAQELKDAIANNNQAAMKEAADSLDEAAHQLQAGTSPVEDGPPPEDGPQARRK